MAENTRQPAVAGSFYEANPRLLEAEIRAFLDEAREHVKVPTTPPRALIVPHAGHIYSGPIAARAYALLQGHAFKRVILIGPSHRVAFRGAALSPAQFFKTPLGSLPLDHSLDDVLLQIPGVLLHEAPHALEHCLEVQIPFLQCVLKDLSLIPIVVGEAEPDLVSQIIEALSQDSHNLIIISSDLSHYLPYRQARETDKATAEAILNLQGAALADESACGRLPIQGLLMAAQKNHWRPRLLDLRNSGDTAGGRDQVVGYGAWVFS